METSALIANIATAIGAFFAGASIYLAIFVYARERDKTVFASLRTGLVDINLGIKQLDMMLSERAFAEIGRSIAHEIEYLIGSDATPYEITSALEDKTDTGHVGVAILLGLARSTTVGRIDQQCDALDRLPIANANQITIVREALDGLIYYAISTAKAVVSANLFHKVLTSQQALDEFREHAVTLKTSKEAYSELVVFLTSASKAVLGKDGQAIVDDVRKIVNIVTRVLNEKHDKQLRSLRRRLNSVQVNDVPESPVIEGVFLRLDYLRDLFSDKQWDSMVEAKARIVQRTRKTDG